MFINNNYAKAPVLWEKGNNLWKEHVKLSLNKKDVARYQQIRDLQSMLRYTNEISGLLR